MDKQNLNNIRFKNIYVSSFYNCSEDSRYMGIIGSKTLKNSSGRIQVDIDRLFDELRYLMYYSNISEGSVYNFFLSIIIASRSYEQYEDVAIDLCDKLSRFYTKVCKKNISKYTLLVKLRSFDFFIREIASTKKIDVEEFIDKLRNIMVEYSPNYVEKVDKVRFQIEKLKYIDKIYEDVDDKREKLIYLLDKSVEGIVDYSIEEKILSTLVEGKLIDSIAEYILKVRTGNLNTPVYKKGADPRKFIKMNVGDKGVDPILNRFEVIKKEESQGILIIHILCKTGEYKFRFEVKN